MGRRIDPPSGWCNTGRGGYYPVCGMVHIKDSLLIIINITHVMATLGFLSLSDWSLVRCHITVNT